MPPPGHLPGRRRATWRGAPCIAWLGGKQGIPRVSPGCCCMAVRGAVAGWACCSPSIWRASGSLRQTSAEPAPRVPRGRFRATTRPHWWLTSRRSGCIWVCSAGRCSRAPGAPWWRSCTPSGIPSTCRGWCCAGRSVSRGERSAGCWCPRRARERRCTTAPHGPCGQERRCPAPCHAWHSCSKPQQRVLHRCASCAAGRCARCAMPLPDCAAACCMPRASRPLRCAANGRPCADSSAARRPGFTSPGYQGLIARHGSNTGYRLITCGTGASFARPGSTAPCA